MLISWNMIDEKHPNGIHLTGEFLGMENDKIRVIYYKRRNSCYQQWLVSPQYITSVASVNLPDRTLVIQNYIGTKKQTKKLLNEIHGKVYKLIFLSKRIKNYEAIYTLLHSHISICGKKIGQIITY